MIQWRQKSKYADSIEMVKCDIVFSSFYIEKENYYMKIADFYIEKENYYTGIANYYIGICFCDIVKENFSAGIRRYYIETAGSYIVIRQFEKKVTCLPEIRLLHCDGRHLLIERILCIVLFFKFYLSCQS